MDISVFNVLTVGLITKAALDTEMNTKVQCFDILLFIKGKVPTLPLSLSLCVCVCNK